MSVRTNPLSSAMETETKYTYGDNGALELKTSGSMLLDNFTNLVKTTESEVVHKAVSDLISDMQACETDDVRAEYIHDIFILAFHKRSTSKSSDGEQISDGEGCKNIYYEYILELYNYYPDTIVELFRSAVPFMYGYWKDALNIWVKINELDMDIRSKYSKYNKLIEAFRYAMLYQRNKDLEIIYNLFDEDKIKFRYMNSDKFKRFLDRTTKDYKTLNITNVGKYCVRESTSFDTKAYWYLDNNSNMIRENHVNYMIRGTLKQRSSSGVNIYPINKPVPFGARKIWRLDNVKLNIILDVAETHFSGKTWSEINIGHLPSLCFKRNSRALINEKLNENIVIGSCYDETGNRYPEDIDRIGCRNNVIDHIASGKKINSSQIYPHNIIASLNPSNLEIKMMQAQWNSAVNLTKEKMDNIKVKLIEDMIGLESPEISERVSLAISSGNILGCCDTSASMTWVGKYPERPFDIALALTAFMSEVASDEWRDIAMSFSTNPNIISFKVPSGKPIMDVFQRIELLKMYSGGSTNYLGLHKELLRICIDKNIKEQDIPVLVIFSDGNFNMQCSMYSDSGKKITHENVIKLWVDAGYRSPPVVVYWNLAINKTSVQVEKNMPGVQLMGGASPSNFKYILYGELAEEVTKEVEIDGEIVTITTKDISPLQTFRNAMDQPYFDKIRIILKDSVERELQFYN